MTKLTKIGLSVTFLGAIMKLVSTLAMPSVANHDLSVPVSPLLVPMGILTLLSFVVMPIGIILIIIGLTGKK